MHHRSRSLTHLICCAHVFVFSLGVIPSFAQVEAAPWPSVRFRVFAFDTKGDPLPGLAPDDLILKQDGHVQKITAISKVTGPESLCILVDSSGSMYGRAESTKAALIRLIKALPAEDEVCLADFSAVSFLDKDLTTDHAAVIDSLKFLKASGGTALYDSVIAMARYMRKTARYSSRSIVLISDGDDNASKANKRSMIEELMILGSPVVDVFRLPSQDDARNWLKERWVSDAARVSGGLSYSPSQTKNMDAAIANFLAALNGRYSVAYQAEPTTTDGRQRALTVSIDRNKELEKAEIRAPERYYASSQ